MRPLQMDCIQFLNTNCTEDFFKGRGLCRYYRSQPHLRGKTEMERRHKDSSSAEVPLSCSLNEAQSQSRNLAVLWVLSQAAVRLAPQRATRLTERKSLSFYKRVIPVEAHFHRAWPASRRRRQTSLWWIVKSKFPQHLNFPALKLRDSILKSFMGAQHL